MKLHAACALLMIGLPLLTAAGCSAGASSATPESAEAGALAEEAGAVAPADAGTDSSTGQSPSGELKIVSLSTTVSTVTGGNPTSTESAGVTFVAIVTDAHGLDSIAGGQLIDKDGRTYAAFGAGSNKGTFAATIDFAAMNTVRAIDFEGTKTDRTFIAKFFDNAGNEASAPVTLTLACRSALLGLVGACGGQCVDVSRDGANCGACGKTCTSGQLCANKACGAAVVDGNGYTSCLPTTVAGPLASCKTLCMAAGGTCTSYGLRSYYANDPSCQVPASGVGPGTNQIDAPYFTCDCGP